MENEADDDDADDDTRKEEEEKRLPLGRDLLEGPFLVVVDGVTGHEGELVGLGVQRHTLPQALVEHHMVLLPIAGIH